MLAVVILHQSLTNSVPENFVSWE